MKPVLARMAVFTCAGAAAAAMSAFAAEMPAKADLAKGQTIAAQACAACHAADGNSPTSANPSLAGQIPEYLEKQLVNFKPAQSKKPDRENPMMMGMSMPLSAEDMRNVAAYYAAQASKGGAARNKDTLALGRKLWRGGDTARGVPACASCHGATGAGVPAQYPRIAGQYAEYTEAQLKAFRSGARTNDSNKMMRTIASRMNDEEIKAVADYAAGLR